MLLKVVAKRLEELVVKEVIPDLLPTVEEVERKFFLILLDDLFLYLRDVSLSPDSFLRPSYLSVGDLVHLNLSIPYSFPPEVSIKNIELLLGLVSSNKDTTFFRDVVMLTEKLFSPITPLYNKKVNLTGISLKLTSGSTTNNEGLNTLFPLIEITISGLVVEM